jgi:hypothetical protein
LRPHGERSETKETENEKNPSRFHINLLDVLTECELMGRSEAGPPSSERNAIDEKHNEL